MKKPQQLEVLPATFQWIGLASLAGILVGSAIALFSIILNRLTGFREVHPWIIAFLPLAGLGMGLIYHYFGKSVEGGNNLIIDEIHEPTSIIPVRMAGLIIVATWVAHLFGGSVGREGTAFQIGGSLADQLNYLFKLQPHQRKILLMSGLAAGFAAIFGTPLAGAIFGLEVLYSGRMKYEAIFPCFMAAIISDLVARAWGVQHELFSVGLVSSITVLGVASALVAGAIFGIVGSAFASGVHHLQHFFKRVIDYAPFRPLVGGILVASLVFALGSTRYIGLGLETIGQSFHERVLLWDFFGKYFFTVLTLGSGFQGGEVTPLFFIGSTLGNALSTILPLPFPVLAGMGFVGVFAGASNTPLASTLMAVELFGSGSSVYMAVACVASYLFSGHARIYASQRLGWDKSHEATAQNGDNAH